MLLHYDGDVAEIQSYAVSWAETDGKSAESRLRLEEIAYGDTVDCGKLVEDQFTRWIEESFGNSVSNLSAKTFANEQLMAEFTEVRRNYKIDQKSLYHFPLIPQNPPYKAPYDSHSHACQVNVEVLRASHGLSPK